MGQLLFVATLMGTAFVLSLTFSGLLAQTRYRFHQARARRLRQPMQLVVRRKRVAGQYAQIFLELPKGGRLPRFRGGDSLALIRPGCPPVRRRYSLAGWHARPCSYELLIKRESNGRVSPWVHDELTEGAIVAALPPQGAFRLDRRRGVRVFIGAGVGITPLRAMLHESQGPNFPTSVLYWVTRNAADLGFYHQELLMIATREPRFTYRPIVTRPGPDWHGETQRPSIARVLEEVPRETVAGIWMCTAPTMADDLRAQALAAGLADQLLHCEAFGGGVAVGGAPAEVQLDPDGSVLSYEGQPTLLHLFDEAGIDLRQDCRAGHCGACVLRVVDGKTKEVLRPGVPVPAGCVLACCVQPVAPSVRFARIS